MGQVIYRLVKHGVRLGFPTSEVSGTHHKSEVSGRRRRSRRRRRNAP